MARYEWRAGAPKPKVEADVFGAEVERIAKENGGIAPPEKIVEAAQQPGSPIASAFEWNSEAAAHQHRLAQARRWVGSLVTVRVEVRHSGEAQMKGFHSVLRPDGQRGYAATDQIVGDRDLRRQVITQAARDLKAQIARFRTISALGAFVPRLQAVLDDIEVQIEHLSVDAKPRSDAVPKSQAEERPAA